MSSTFECCVDCKDRHLNCHSDCPAYLLAKEETAAENLKRAEYKRNRAAGFRTNKKRGQI